MRAKLLLRQLTNIIACIGLVIFLCPQVKAQDTGLLVVGNHKSVPSELKKFQLNSVLKGEKQRWDDGTKVVIALMEPDTPVGRNTCTRVYNMSANELQKHFLALVFQGKGRAPNFFESVSELEAFVAKTPGAIGVLERTSDNTLKTVLVDGKRNI